MSQGASNIVISTNPLLSSIGIETAFIPIWTYAFEQAGEDVYRAGFSGGSDLTSEWTEEEKDAFREVAARYMEVANVTLTEVASTADSSIDLQMVEDVPGGVGGYASPGGGAVVVGHAGNYLMTHELGHTLLLSHPFELDYTGVLPGVTSAYSPGDFGFNSTAFTTQAYGYNNPFPQYDYWGFWLNTHSLGTLDIAALQAMYGANETFANGDDVYGLTDRFETIWDTGGTDTIDFSASTYNGVIDLRAATLEVEEGGLGRPSLARLFPLLFEDHGGYNIAYGVVIENALAGSGNDRVTGNSADNFLDGGSGDDTMRGNGGNDRMIGGADEDLIAGNDGNDTARGGMGDDRLFGGAGDDNLRGEDGADVLEGGADNDVVAGNDGDDTAHGGAGEDRLFGGNDNDELHGDAGNDSVNGGTGDDLLLGGDDNDTLDGESGSDTLAGNNGDDTVRGGLGDDRLFGGNDNDDLRGEAGNDSLNGGNGSDLLLGGDDRDTLDGGAEADTLAGNDGDDTLRGGAGDDRAFGGNGGDLLLGESDNDTLDGGRGADTLAGNDGNDRLLGGDDGDRLFGGNDDDTLAGNDGDDYLSGGPGHDRVLGGAGADTLVGGAGQDVLGGGSGADVFVFNDVADSPLLTRDQITDFEDGVDMIDLSGFAGTLTFVASYTGTAGEVRYNDSLGRLYIDVDGDRTSDFAVDVAGAPTIDAADLIL